MRRIPQSCDVTECRACSARKTREPAVESDGGLGTGRTPLKRYLQYALMTLSASGSNCMTAPIS